MPVVQINLIDRWETLLAGAHRNKVNILTTQRLAKRVAFVRVYNIFTFPFFSVRSHPDYTN